MEKKPNWIWDEISKSVPQNDFNTSVYPVRKEKSAVWPVSSDN